MNNEQLKLKDISIVLGTYNRLRFLKLTIDSIREGIKDIPNEIIVIDGGSMDGTLKWLMKQKDIITIVQHNRGQWNGKPIERRSWGYFMNLGFKCAQGKYVCMLSDDCLVIPGAIRNGYNLFEEELKKGNNVGAMAFYWRNWPEQKKYIVGLTLGGGMFVNHGMYLKSALEDVGYIDEDSFYFYHADGDLCLRMWQKGYVCIDSPNSFVEHYSHANLSIRRTNFQRERNDWENYVSKWDGIFDFKASSCIEKEYHDPYLTVKGFSQFESRKTLVNLFKMPFKVGKKVYTIFLDLYHK